LKAFFLPLTEPVGAIWLLMLVGLVYWCVRRQWKFAITLAVPVSLLFLAGSTPLAEWLVAAEERVYAKPLPAGHADAVVVLGGGFYKSDYDTYAIAFSSGSSRVVTGMELVRSQVTTNLVLGGSWPVKGQETPVNDRIQRWVASFGLGGVALHNLGFCWNTHDEAIAFKKLQKAHEWEQVYLVTSALHLRRSVAVFQRQGIAVTPIGCDFQAYGTTPAPFSIFPSRSNLNLLALYLHERIGMLVYKLRGWI